MKKVSFKTIRAVYETNSINEEAAKYLNHHKPIKEAKDVFEAFNFLKEETKEYFIALHLDTKNRILCMDIVSIGNINSAFVTPREVFKTALLSSAAALILIHNHPSGDSKPSDPDMKLTRDLKEIADLMHIKLLDHIIIGEDCTSFAEIGIL